MNPRDDRQIAARALLGMAFLNWIFIELLTSPWSLTSCLKWLVYMLAFYCTLFTVYVAF
jgi:hypothetical protein